MQPFNLLLNKITSILVTVSQVASVFLIEQPEQDLDIVYFEYKIPFAFAI